MATRFYFAHSTNADLAIGAVLGSQWDDVDEYTTPTRVLQASKSPSSGGVSTERDYTTVGTGTNPNDVIVAQYISDPLAAQTISGNVSGCIRVDESNLGANARSQMGVYVVNSAGSLVATLYNGETGSHGNEFALGPTGRAFPRSSQALSSYACAAGDRLVVEIGARLSTTNTTYSIGFWLGCDDTRGDLSGEGDNSALNPWVEFTHDFTFDSGGGPVDFTPTAFGAEAGFQAGVSFDVGASPDVVFTPDAFGAEVGFQSGVVFGAGDDVVILPAVIGLEAGFQSGFVFRASGLRQVMLTGAGLETPEMTTGGQEGYVLTFHTDGPPTWEPPCGCGS